MISFEEFKEKVTDGGTLGELRGLNKPAESAIYAEAAGALEVRDFNRATSLFGFLVAHNHVHQIYWAGFAKALSGLNLYPAAICAWMAARKIEKHPDIALALARAYAICGDEEMALEFIDEALELSDEERIHKTAEALEDYLVGSKDDE